jgi:hypothetical protein
LKSEAMGKPANASFDQNASSELRISRRESASLA